MGFEAFQKHPSNLLIPSAACIGVFLISRFLKKLFNDQILKIQKQKSIDSLRVNKFITFFESKTCKNHVSSEDCGNLECNYGKFRYLISFIDKCERTLDVCVCFLTSKELENSIVKAFKRGVRVRVVTDAESSLVARSCTHKFRELNIPIRQQMTNFMMHHKFIIIDRTFLINGSMNFTLSATYANWESAIITSKQSIVKAYQTNFEELWLDFDPNTMHARYLQENKIVENSGLPEMMTQRESKCR